MNPSLTTDYRSPIRRSLTAFGLAFALLGLTPSPARALPPPSDDRPVVLNFDWDDNLVYMPTQITLYRKAGIPNGLPETRGVSTDDFALIRDKIGKSGEWENYELRKTATENSFLRFGPAGDGPGGRNYFLEDLKETILSGKSGWKGPAWDAMIFALSNEETAKNFGVITARSHLPEEMLEAFEWLRSIGYIRHLPALENLHAVGGAADPSGEKAKIMIEELAELEAIPPGKKWKSVEGPDPMRRGQYHVWTFSDDDWGNFTKARDAIGEEMQKGKFGNTKVMLFFTGVNHPTEKPHGIVLLPSGEPRPLTAAEEAEVATARRLGRIDCGRLLRAPRASAI